MLVPTAPGSKPTDLGHLAMLAHSFKSTPAHMFPRGKIGIVPGEGLPVMHTPAHFLPPAQVGDVKPVQLLPGAIRSGKKPREPSAPVSPLIPECLQRTGARRVTQRGAAGYGVAGPVC